MSSGESRSVQLPPETPSARGSQVPPRARLSIVLVAAAHPVRSSVALVASLGNQIQVVVVDIKLVVASVVARVGVEHRAVLVLVEDAVAFAFAGPGVAH